MAANIIKSPWQEWQIKQELGHGSYGYVYRAERNDNGIESRSAIKVISIPFSPSDIDTLRSEGFSINDTKSLLKKVVDDFVNEIKIMYSLKGMPNIVNIEDYKVVERTNDIGWDICIRMELLTPFNKYMCDKRLTEKEVIKLGCDICMALEICNKFNIIHGNIKPGNIFINDFGYYKLGGFGVARKMETISDSLCLKGFSPYIAPEINNGTGCDTRADIYSLGIMLYRLLNNYKLPFLNAKKQIYTFQEQQSALDRIYKGEALPRPYNASAMMSDLILRACEYDPDMRFSSATEMKHALMDVENGTYEICGFLDLERSILENNEFNDCNNKKKRRILHPFKPKNK